MLEWMLANPGWTTIGVIVVILAIFGLILIALFVAATLGWDDVDEKHRQQREARREKMRQIYEDPNRFEQMRRHTGDPNGWGDRK